MRPHDEIAHAGGTRRAVGRPMRDGQNGALARLDVSGLGGIVKYEPEELIISALPATPLAEITAVLAEKGQRLGFDPADWSQLLGSDGTATLAGAISCDASGSGKLRHGAARDSLGLRRREDRIDGRGGGRRT